MKKFLTAFLCTLLTVAFAFCFSACKNQPENGNNDDSQENNEPVKLVAITGTEVGVRSDVDYYVVPEPAATTKVNAIQALNFVGDLQQLYGGENGYPQAVVVAKTELATGSSFVSNFATALSHSKDWLLADSTEATTIVNAVQNHLTEGMSPTFSANNLSKSVIKNCGINFVSAKDDKQEIINFMQKINSVSETSFGTPSDNFFWDGSHDTAEYSGTVSVYAPDGAPALGIANLLAGVETFNGVTVNYEIVDSTVIQTYVSGNNNSQADICVLPVNIAVKLLGSGEKYKLIGTLTHGNLFMTSTDGTQITIDNISSLRGKTVGVVNLAAVPGLTFKLILKDNDIDFTEVA